MQKEPRIKQLIPVNDVWMRSKEEDGSFYFDKVIAMALVEHDNYFEGIYYLCRCDLEIIDGLERIQNQDDFFFTHEIPEDALRKSYRNALE